MLYGDVQGSAVNSLQNNFGRSESPDTDEFWGKFPVTWLAFGSGLPCKSLRFGVWATIESFNPVYAPPWLDQQSRSPSSGWNPGWFSNFPYSSSRRTNKATWETLLLINKLNIIHYQGTFSYSARVHRPCQCRNSCLTLLSYAPHGCNLY